MLYYYYSVCCLTTGPKPLPKRFLHIVRSKASSFKWEYPLLSLRSSNSFLRLLPRLLVTSISPFIFPSITSFRRQFLRQMWPIQVAFRFRISRRIFLCSLTRSNTSSFLTWSIQLIFSILLQHHNWVYCHRLPVSSRDSVVGVSGHAAGWATKYSWFNSRYERETHFSKASRPIVTHTTCYSNVKNNSFYENNADGTERDQWLPSGATFMKQPCIRDI